MVNPWKPKLHIKLQPESPKDKHYKLYSHQKDTKNN
jgi:hypothetical protein